MQAKQKKEYIHCLPSAGQCSVTSRNAALIAPNDSLGRQTPILRTSPPSSSFTPDVIAEHDATSPWPVWVSFWLCPLPAPCAHPSCSLAGQQEKQESIWLCVSTALQQKRWCIIFLLSPKHSMYTMKEINSIVEETKT